MVLDTDRATHVEATASRARSWQSRLRKTSRVWSMILARRKFIQVSAADELGRTALHYATRRSFVGSAVWNADVHSAPVSATPDVL